MQGTGDQGQRKELSATEARAGRIVKGGAVRRILWVSVALAVVALFLAYVFLAGRG